MTVPAARPAALLPVRPHLRDKPERLLRLVPIRWRILSIAGLNTLLALILAGVIFAGARDLERSWQDLRQARQSERLLASLDTEAGRLQSLIHRYISQPDPAVLDEIVRRGWTLSGNLATRAGLDPALAGSAGELVAVNERLLGGFDDLRRVQATIAATYEADVARAARAVTGLYTGIEVSADRNGPAWSVLGRSREAFAAALAAATTYYLSPDPSGAERTQRHLDTVERSLPALSDLASGAPEKALVEGLREQIGLVRRGLVELGELFAERQRLLREEIDGNQAARMRAVDQLAASVRTREAGAQARFDQALAVVYRRLAIVTLAFVGVSALGGLVIAASISRPLRELRDSMHAIVAGDYTKVRGLGAQDEIGSMARAVAVFRENAVARERAESELRTAKERAERALAELQVAQRSLIEAEKLAALGGLVAGVAHEVNNPVGISLTVASSLSRRCDVFATELESGQLRRSRLAEFVEGNRDAANQLVANLQRAGELIQAFKQVAVDRSHADRRWFDLGEAVEQIMSSLRPGLKKSNVELSLDVPAGIVMDSYPGPLGQVLTNLFLNAVTHAFPDGRSGRIRIAGRPIGTAAAELTFTDDGVGMSAEVQRKAFDPFFTTRRSQGGTGLGLHIVYNLVTARLGGEIVLETRASGGTVFKLVLPLVAPSESAAAPEQAFEATGTTS